MLRYLAALVWVVVVAVPFPIAMAVARRYPAEEISGVQVREASGRHGRRGGPETSAGWLGGLDLGSAARFLVMTVAGTVVVVGIMALLGVLVVNHGGTIDGPIHSWVVGHQVHVWARLMDRLTKIGDTWTTWGAGVAAAVCLAVTWRGSRWLPPAAFALAIVFDHYAALALRHVFHRVGPPQSPLGTYPSGGCDRVVFFYGLMAYLLWIAFSRRRRTAVWAIAVVAALGLSEAYSRVYLSKHWFTDALSGLLYGLLMLVVFIVAIRAVLGTGASRRAGDGRRVEESPEVREGLSA